MRFFTYERWIALQSRGEKADRAWREWDASFSAYQEHLRSFATDCGKQVAGTLSAIDLHDGVIAAMTLPDREKVAITLQHGNNAVLLRFAGVQAWSMDFDARKAQLSFEPMLEWGYEELSELPDGILRLEVLFSSGATLKIDFRELLAT